MPIVPSRSSEIQRLAQSLGQGRAADRESAIARLTLLGERALPTVLEVLRRGTNAARVDALAVVEQHDSPGARGAVHASASDPELPVARRAVEACAHYPDARTVEVLRTRTRSGPQALRLAAVESLLALLESGLVETIDPLLEIVLAEGEDEAVRRAALPALSSLSPRERAPLLARLRDRPRDAVGHRLLQGIGGGPAGERRVAVGAKPPAGRNPSPESRETIDRLVKEGGPAAIATLHGLLARLPRADEKAAQGRDTAAFRGEIHRALATLGSRIALYDLRESLAVRPSPAPSPLLAAAATVGDKSLVPALAALATDAPALQAACVAALTAIVGRERLRRTSASVRAVRPSDHAILDRLWPRRKEETGTKSGQRGTTSRKTR